ncbi:MAG: molybdate ABC transporter permease subunit [Pyrinomonadaceae bacterium]|nr:molybdate ABC transporter permease subunit [Pyrinomonadaceae bacterium]
MIWSAFQLSLLVVIISTAIVGVAGLAFAYLIAKFEFPGKELLDAVLTMPLVLPPTVTGYYLIVLLGRNGFIGGFVYDLTGWSFAFTWQGAVIAAFIVSLPLMIRASRASIESVNPNYEIASYTLGKGKFETFLKITLPLAKRGIFAGLILSFARALGEFGATLMIAGNIPGKTQTMPLAIYEAVASGDDKNAQILALILTAISILAVYLTNKISRSHIYG